jgi:HSP20 family protein
LSGTLKKCRLRFSTAVPSSDDKWFKRWGRPSPSGPWSYAGVDEMMKEMERDFLDLDIEKDLPQELLKDDNDPRGDWPRSAFYGFSLALGPDIEPAVEELGRPFSPDGEREYLGNEREPIVELVQGEHGLRVIAEVPGAAREGIALSVVGRTLTISAEAPAKKRRTDIELPFEVDPDHVTSRFNNGILEVNLKKAGRSGTTVQP